VGNHALKVRTLFFSSAASDHPPAGEQDGKYDHDTPYDEGRDIWRQSKSRRESGKKEQNPRKGQWDPAGPFFLDTGRSHTREIFHCCSAAIANQRIRGNFGPALPALHLKDDDYCSFQFSVVSFQKIGRFL
jgi:hypothetical protein